MAQRAARFADVISPTEPPGHRHPGLYIAQAPGRGRGVFCAADITAGALIEVCPVIVLPKGDLERVHATRLHDYYFLWAGEGETAIALGFGSLYNHADDSNADYEMHFAEETLHVIAERDIPAGEEICIDYTDGQDRSTLWF